MGETHCLLTEYLQFIMFVFFSKNPGEVTHQPFKWRLNQRNRSSAPVVRLVPIRSGSSSRKSRKSEEIDEGFGSNGSSSSSTSSANANVVVIDVGKEIRLSKGTEAAAAAPDLVITEADPIIEDTFEPEEVIDLDYPTLASHPAKLRSKSELNRQAKEVVNSALEQAAQELYEETDGIIFEFKRFEDESCPGQ